MKVKRVSIIVAILLGLFSLNFAIGHPGRTDKNGGHYNRKTGEYHYHSTPKSTYSALETTSKGSESKKATIHPVVPAEDFSNDTAYPVLRTIDGDTVEIQYSGKPTMVRLIGVDTPETVHPQKAVEAFGKEASAFTRNLLLGEEVYLRFDHKTASVVGELTDKIDKYGRMLAYLYRVPDGLFVNLEIVRQGYGHAYTQFPFKHIELFRYYERRAREAGKGLWGNTAVSIATEATKAADAVEKAETEQPSDKNQNDIVYITKTGKKYHRAGCRYLSKSAIPIERKEAIARGYTPCSVCKP